MKDSRTVLKNDHLIYLKALTYIYIVKENKSYDYIAL